MRVYADSDVYLSALLGERDSGLSNRFFDACMSGRFTLIFSNTAAVEVNRKIESVFGGHTLETQTFFEKLRSSGHLETVKASEEERLQARERNENELTLDGGGKQFGQEDFTHILLAQRSADVFVTRERALKPVAARFVRTLLLKEFMEELEA